MGRRKHIGRDMTIEQFDQWSANVASTGRATSAGGEEGGPRVTLVPDPISVKFMPPTDQIDPVAADAVVNAAPAATAPGDPLAAILAFDAEPSRKLAGWSAFRQRIFIETLAETGSVHVAAEAAELSARGAYALRVRSPAFAAAWSAALQLAVGRLAALAFDRAIHGRIEQIYHEGQLIGERRVPSERLLMWLLARLDPKAFAAPWERRKDDVSDPQGEAQAAFPALLDALTDTPAFTARVAATLLPDADRVPPLGECEHS